MKDRELDVLVAEKVFGDTVKWHGKVPFGANGDGEPVPYYSEEIADHWRVVERMLENLWDFEMRHYRDVYPEARFVRDGSERWCLGRTIGFAICVGALHALGSEVQ
jgi:hypothetical protein